MHIRTIIDVVAHILVPYGKNDTYPSATVLSQLIPVAPIFVEALSTDIEDTAIAYDFPFAPAVFDFQGNELPSLVFTDFQRLTSRTHVFL